jgi:hypothetical protein
VVASKTQHVGGGMPGGQGIRVLLSEFMPSWFQYCQIFGVCFVKPALGLEEHGEALSGRHCLRVIFTDGPRCPFSPGCPGGAAARPMIVEF